MSDQDTGNGAAKTNNPGDDGKNPQENNQQMKGIPIFYGNPEILDSERHKDLGLAESESFSFAAPSNAIPINAAEFSLASRDYPIVFIGDTEMSSVAIVGLRADQNLMVDSAGKWAEGTYIPAYVRRYPFILVRDDGGTQYALCIDRASKRISKSGGQNFFEGSERTELCKRALDFCALFQRHFMATEAIIKQFRDLDLLVSHQSQFTLASGEALTLKDFKIIDENKFNKLSDDDFLSLRKSGALAAAYCHLVSLSSWQNLFRLASA